MMKNADRIAHNWLHIIGTAGVLLSLVAFLVYIFGLLPGSVDPSSSSEAWSLGTTDYLDKVDVQTGALWMFRSLDGYSLSSASLAILASTALPTLLALAAAWFRRKDWLFGGISVAICIVLVIAILS